MPSRTARSPRRRSFFHGFRWRLLAKVAGAALAVLLVVALVPPLREAVALGASKVILFVASPLAPEIEDFERLPETTTVLAADGSVLAELDKAQRRVPVDLDDLPDHVTNAVLAAEDESFYEHSGIDPQAVFRAFLRTATGNTQGGSTITQQLAKINYTAGERTVFRKLKELLFASKLEQKYSKKTLLQRYLNQVYFGEQSYGIEAAAQTFFAKSAKDLTPAEAALLAGKIRAPARIDPRNEKRLDETEERRNQVLTNMREEGWLKKAEFDAAVDEPIVLAPRRTEVEQVRAPHFVEYVKREAATIDALGASRETRANRLFTGGYTIETTLDPKAFDATVASAQARLGDPNDPVVAVATVVPGDGAIRNLFGGLDFFRTQLDMASLAGRQAGSSVKPFTYLASLRDGIHPRTTFDGTSGRVIPCYTDKPVSNYAGEDAGGQISVDDALAKSVNVVFVDLGCQVGTSDVARAAADAGLPQDATKNKGGWFLGGFDGSGVNALEMASAYATFAAKGVYAKPYAITTIKNARGDVIYKAKPATRQAFSAGEVGVLNNPLQQVVARGTGTKAAIGRPVAGKTGTTQDNVDAWFIGYTPQLATGVWVGYPEKNQPMKGVHGVAGVTGGSFPAMIFGDVMRKAHEGMPVQKLHAVSADELNLKTRESTVPTSSTSSTSSTTSSVPDATTTSVPASTTTARGSGATTTTAPPPTTTTTARKTSTTTTTAPSSTSSTTVQASSGGSSGTTTTTTA